MQEGLILDSKYKIVKKIQSGGQANIYLAYIENNELSFVKEVAIKFFTSSDTSQKNFESEIKVLSTLNHPNIAKIYDVGTYNGIPYLVLEYIDGPNLKELREKLFIKNVIFSTGDVLLITEKVLESLLFIHSLNQSNLLHRDISPSNIIVSKEGFVKLVDFGISQIPTDQLAGKPAYLPQEVLDGRRAYTKATDYYSLGVITYELLTQRKVKEEKDIDLSVIPDKTVRSIVKDLLHCDTDAAKILKRVQKEKHELEINLSTLVNKAFDEQYITEKTIQDIQSTTNIAKGASHKKWILILASLSFSLFSFWYFYKHTPRSHIEFFLETSSHEKILVTPPALGLVAPVSAPDKFSKASCDNYCYSALVSMATGHKDFYDKAIKDPQFRELLETSYNKQFYNFKRFYRPMATHFESYGDICSTVSARCLLAKGFFRYIDVNAPVAMTDAEFDRNLRKVMDGTDKTFKKMAGNVNANKIKKPKKSYAIQFLKKFGKTFYNIALLKGNLDKEACRDVGDEVYLLKSSLSKKEEDETFFLHDFDVIIFNNISRLQFKGEEKNIPVYEIERSNKDHAIQICHYQRSEGKLTILHPWKVVAP